MIKELNIKGFRLFQDLKLKNLNFINIFGGKNNSGKTSILEAILLFYDRGNPEVIVRQLSLRNINSIALNSDSLWASIFNRYDLDSIIEMTVKDDNVKDKVVIKHNANYFKQITSSIPIPEQPTHIKTDQKAFVTESLDFKYYSTDKEIGSTHLIIDKVSLGMQIDNLTKLSKKIIFIGSYTSRNPNEDANKFGQLDVTGKIDDIVEILKIIEPRLKSLTSVPQGNISLIHGDIGLGRKIPIQYMGEGTSRLLSIILSIANNKDGMVLIDEIENGFHYSIMSKVWKVIYQTSKKYNCQIMVTTHSYEALKYLAEEINDENKDSFTYIRLDSINENIVPKLYSAEMLASAIEHEWEVR
jgi:AAA15 family ATPase/GTPase